MHGKNESGVPYTTFEEGGESPSNGATKRTADIPHWLIGQINSRIK
jgi:hypothetical protein